MNRIFLTLSIASCLFLSASAAEPTKKTYDDPANVDADYAYQGEYLGEFAGESGKKTLGIQVVAQGNNKFYAIGYDGGLPGDWKRGGMKHDGKGELKDGVLSIGGDHYT